MCVHMYMYVYTGDQSLDPVVMGFRLKPQNT